MTVSSTSTKIIDACALSWFVGSSGVCALRLVRKREEMASSCLTWPKANERRNDPSVEGA